MNTFCEIIFRAKRAMEFIALIQVPLPRQLTERDNLY
jgi:hypothetical protein